VPYPAIFSAGGGQIIFTDGGQTAFTVTVSGRATLKLLYLSAPRSPIGLQTKPLSAH
jgi:hypothetical protein